MARTAHILEDLTVSPDGKRLGAYRLVQLLGEGGFAPVFLAKETYGETELRDVALKLFTTDPEAGAHAGGSSGSGSQSVRNRARIIEEARTLCSVEHPNVVRFYTLFDDPAENLVGLVMEYVQGTALALRLEQQKTLPIDETLAVGIAVASALAAVHHVGLVHCDVKPGNILETRGVYKLIDFGIAAADPGTRRGHAPESRALSRKRPSQRPPGPAITNVQARGASGTEGYIDPECVAAVDRGERAHATPSSDLYSLGATLYECLAGAPPAMAAAIQARGDGEEGELLKGTVLTGAEAPPAIAVVAPDAPRALADLIDSLVHPSAERRPKSAEAVALELERVRRAVAGRSRPLPPEAEGPFRGLGRFEEKDRDVYFGRSVEVAACIEMLRSRGLLALVGASGSGKSSLGRAGVLPAIADGALGRWPKQWDAVITVPGVDPVAAITAALAPFIPDVRAQTPETLVPAIAARAQETGRGLVLFVDQLEELVTVSSPASQSFLAQLLATFGKQVLPGVRAVVAARRDLLDQLLALPSLDRALPRATLVVAPLSDAAWEEVLDQALGAYDYRLEDAALRADLLGQLKGTATAMPLVQFALTELWNRRDEANKLVPRGALQAIGGISGALEIHAEATLAKIDLMSTDARTMTKQLLLALTTAQGTRALVGKSVPRARFAGDRHARILATLSEARLVIEEGDGLTLAHEALLTQWRTLASWLAEARQDRVLVDDIERAATAWKTDREEDLLWRRGRLVAAIDILRRKPDDLSFAAIEFLHASRRVSLRTRALALGLAGAVLFGAITFGGYTVSTARDHAAQIGAEQEKTQRFLEEARVERDRAREAERMAQDAKGEVVGAKAQVEKQSRGYQSDLKDLRERLDNLKTLDKKTRLQELEKLQQDITGQKGAPSATPGALPQAPTAAPIPTAAAKAISIGGEPP